LHLSFSNSKMNSTKSYIRSHIHKQNKIQLDEKLYTKFRFYLDNKSDQTFNGVMADSTDKQYLQSLIQNMIKSPQMKGNITDNKIQDDSYFCRNRNQSTFKIFRYFIQSLVYYFLPFLLAKKKIDFIFLVHIRYEEDCNTHAPYISFLKKLLPTKTYLYLFSLLPPLLLDEFTHANGSKGLLISSTHLPQPLINGKKTRTKEINRSLKFISNACVPQHEKIVISLGAWWPIISLHGQLFEKVLPNDHPYIITTGHTATLYSIVKTAEDLIEKSLLPREQINIAIMGCGNIGFFAANTLLSKGVQVTLIDINEIKLLKLKKQLQESFPDSLIHHHTFSHESVQPILNTCHFGICATSNTKEIIKKEDIPDFFVFIDDSRPEAIPRFDYGDNKYTLEGGLINVQGFQSSFNFGFGNDSNLLGCLSEGYILALDQQLNKTLSPTKSVASVDLYNSMARFCESQNIRPGDYKMGELTLQETTIIQAVRCRHELINR